MHVLLIEAALTGHHAGYLSRAASSYLKAGHDVSIALPEGWAKHESLLSLQEEFGAKLAIVPFPNSQLDRVLAVRGQTLRELAYRRLFGRAYESIARMRRIDYVFLPYLDYCLYALGLAGSPFSATPWGGICMRPSFHFKECDVKAPRPGMWRAKRWLFLRLLQDGTLQKLLTIDETLASYVSSRKLDPKKVLRYLPDPAEFDGAISQSVAREILGIPGDANVILLYGAIDQRKGLDRLLEALVDAELEDAYHLLVVGVLSPWAREQLGDDRVAALRVSGRLHVVDRFVSSAEEQLVFAASNVVWLGYRGHFTMSGVLVLAGKSGKMVVATDAGLVGWYVRNASLGATFGQEDVSEIVAAINDASVRLAAESEQPEHEARRRARFLEHTWKTFSKLVVSDS